MGLDIQAVSRATKVAPPEGCEEPTEWAYENGYVYGWVNSDFSERADGLTDGAYEVDRQVSFRAGSYSGYNRWREWLAGSVLGVSPEKVWGDFDAFTGRPFVELIHFADNEGLIGPVTSAKLAADFAREKPTNGEDDDYYLATYQRFREAFELASDGGFVQFC